MLKKLQFKAVPVTNGHEAVATFRQQRFNGVIVEYELTDMTGLELVRRLREIRPAIPILVLTAYIDPAIQALIKAEGLSFMTKPVMKHELRDALRSLVRN